MAKKSKVTSISFDNQAQKDLEDIRSALQRSYTGSDTSDADTLTFSNSFIVRSALRFYADSLEPKNQK